MLQIQADATSENWPQVIRRCREAHVAYKDLGVWSPDVDCTHWHIEHVRIAQLKDTPFAVVLQTDGIVWSLSESVIQRLREFDYESNNLGWGIDWAAISYAMSHGLMVLRDTSITIRHPKDTGYDKKLASQQQRVFLSQMSLQEKMQFELLNTFIAVRKSLSSS